MFKLYIDEDSMDRDLVRALRARGVDVVTAIDADMMGRSDNDHLLFATGQERVLYSFNRGDFFRIHTQLLADGASVRLPSNAAGVRARCRHGLRRLLKLMALRSVADMRDHVEFLSAWG